MRTYLHKMTLYDQHRAVRELEEALFQAPVFRVPYPLRSQAEPMFIPHVISIGPLHNPMFGQTAVHHKTLAQIHTTSGRLRNVNNQQFPLLEMEGFKQLAVQTLSDYLSFTDLVEFLKSKEQEMLRFYDRKLMEECFNINHPVGSDQVALQALADLVAMDACFIACFLHCLYDVSSDCLQEKFGISEEASVKPKTSYSSSFFLVYLNKLSRPLRKAILQDFLLVENQIPLFAVKEVIRADRRCGSEVEARKRLDMYLAAMALSLLPFSKCNKYVLASVKKLSERGCHLLDCMYSIVCAEGNNDHSICIDRPIGTPLDEQEDSYNKHFGRQVSEDISKLEAGPMHMTHLCEDDYRLELPQVSADVVPGANDLHLSGVTLHGHEGSLKEISFVRGKLSIPKVHVGDDTEKIFRNLIAYESCVKVSKVDILSYVHFMDFLVDTRRDVELLIRQGVITESLGSCEKVAEMWNKLCRNTSCVFSEKYKRVSRHASAYCHSPLQGMWADFYRSNLSRPWLVVPVVSAAALLVMTFVIMWFTLLLYWHETAEKH